MTSEDDSDDDLVPVPGQVEQVNPFRPAPPAVRWLVGGAMLLVSACLLFANLGSYGLWSDEADTVLFAQGIVETGDTSAQVGHNIYAYRQGALLRELKNRVTPPLSYFVLAPVIQQCGANTWAVRLPFALAGWLIVVWAVVWLWRSEASVALWLAVAAAGLGQVSFFLYCRQCRYYALAMLASWAMVYFYVQHRGRWFTLVGLIGAGLMLLASQYLNFAALCGVLIVDHLLWQRRQATWPLRQMLLVAVPLGVAAVGLWWFWSGGPGSGNGPLDRLTLAYWNLRDLHACEGLNLLLVVASPLLYLVTRDAWLLRLPTALVVYAAIVALLSPQSVAITQVADVRYLAPLLPASIALTARWCYWLLIHVDWKAWPVIALAVWTNAAFLLGSTCAAPPASFAAWSTEVQRSFRVTPWEFVCEIALPRSTASRTVSQWLVEHVAAGKSVWVVPGEESYSLMAQAPHVVYAWQLDTPPLGADAGQFRDLPAIHFFGREPVDVMIVYGPYAATPNFVQLLEALKNAGHTYQRSDTLDVFWDDAIRPELFWRRFRKLRDFDRDTQAIYVYQRVQP